MKRAVDNALSTPGSSTSTIPGNLDTSSPPNVAQPIKRFKTFRACTLCRHHKTRCDPVEEPDDNPACRRCRHFNKMCSLQDNNTQAITPVVEGTTKSRRPRSKPKPGPLLPENDKRVVVNKYRELSPHTSPTTTDDYTTSVTRSFAQYILRLPFHDPLRQHGAGLALSLLVRPRGQISDTLEWGAAIEAICDIASGPPKKSDLVTPLRFADPQDLHVIFRALYAPWVLWDSHIAQFPTSPSSTFLQAVQCTLAAKHTPISHPGIHPQHSRDAQAGLYRAMFGGNAGIDDLRALHILSLYTSTRTSLSLALPTEATAAGSGSEFAMTSALGLARVMGLGKEVQAVIDFRRAVKSSSNSLYAPAPLSVLGSLAKCRLLYSLYITQCFMHVGKGRISETPDAIEAFRQAHLVFGSPHALTSTRQGIADAHLVFLSRLCDITIRAFEMPVPEDISRFHTSMRDAILELENWRRDFAPFSALTDDRAPHENQHILLQFQFCKLAVMIRVILAVVKRSPDHPAKRAVIPPPQAPWVSPNLVQSWGSDTISAAESLIIAGLSLTPFKEPSVHSSPYSQPSYPLASAPDYILSMIALSAFILVKSQLHNNRTAEQEYVPLLRAAFRSNGRTRHALLEKLVHLLRKVTSKDGNDLAGRYATALDVFLGILDVDRPENSEAGTDFEGEFVEEVEVFARSQAETGTSQPTSTSDFNQLQDLHYSGFFGGDNDVGVTGSFPTFLSSLVSPPFNFEFGTSAVLGSGSDNPFDMAFQFNEHGVFR